MPRPWYVAALYAGPRTDNKGEKQMSKKPLFNITATSKNKSPDGKRVRYNVGAVWAAQTGDETPFGGKGNIVFNKEDNTKYNQYTLKTLPEGVGEYWLGIDINPFCPDVETWLSESAERVRRIQEKVGMSTDDSDKDSAPPSPFEDSDSPF